MRRLGALGFTIAATTILSFLFSSMPIDQWSTRYLAPIIWAAPFALAPAAWVLTAKRFPLALAPYLIAAAIGGWISFGAYVQDMLPAQEPHGVATEEMALGAALRERGIRYAAAQYWLSYRLTFLWDEAPIVVPLFPDVDRYEGYRHEYGKADVIAYIFDTADPQTRLVPCEMALQATGGRYERLTSGPFVALISSRGADVRDPTACTGELRQSAQATDAH